MQNIVTIGWQKIVARIQAKINGLLVGGILWSLLLAQSVQGVDSYWTNNGNGDFHAATNWSAGLPGVTDNAWFTNNASYQISFSADATNANAFFNAPGGTVTNWIRAGALQIWQITNSYVVGRSSGSTATVNITAGTLLITNASGTARLVVGEDGRGTFMVRGGTITEDQLIVTNGTLDIGYGTLSTLHGSTLSAGDLYVGMYSPGSGQRMTWNIRGGTNIANGANILIGKRYGYGDKMEVTGAGTIWTNLINITIGYLDTEGTNIFVISNGASVYANAATIGNIPANGKSLMIVDGSNSLLNATNLSSTMNVGNYARNSQMIITNGGNVVSPNSRIGIHTRGDGGVDYDMTNNTVIVTGIGSVWSNASVLYVGMRAQVCALTLSQGGKAYSPSAYVGYETTATNAAVTVSGTNAELHVGNLSVGENAPGALLVVSNSGAVFITNTCWLGHYSTSTGNQMRITGGGLYVTNVGNNAQLNVYRGTFSLERMGGTCTLDNLIFTNTLAVLKFIAASNGVIPVNVTSNLTVNSTNAALIVDITAYHGPQITLVNYGQMSTQFTNVTVLGSAGRPFWIDQTDGNRITLKLASGAIISIY